MSRWFAELGTDRGGSIIVEIAHTPEQQSQGLSGRHSIDPNCGMLFVFPFAAVRKFWMSNTYVALDLLFLDGAGYVLAIEQDAQPFDVAPLGPDLPSLFVLEAPAGWSRINGVAPGSNIHTVRVWAT
jgi:uncharacterized membrane protein (UPF0127 family)